MKPWDTILEPDASLRQERQWRKTMTPTTQFRYIMGAFVAAMLLHLMIAVNF